MNAMSTTGAGKRPPMYGLIGKMTTQPGRRDELIAILLDGIDQMPGCISYVVATDPDEEDAIWITEVWDREESHHDSLKMPMVQQAIARGRPLIADFIQSSVITPVGGHGLPSGN